MPLVKKPNSLVNKHHPYLNEVDEQHKRSHKSSMSYSSFSDSSTCTTITHSVSAAEESTSGWKLSFCGVLSSSAQDLDKNSDAFDHSFSNLSIPKSSSCQIPACEVESQSSPIPVPIRKGSRKRKCNFRSSGGYFFDKYMKKFQERYNSNQSLYHSETIDELKVSQFHDKLTTEVPMRFPMRSNREDLVCSQPIAMNSQCDEFSCSSMDSLADDDLYPLRFGTSSQWSSQCPKAPHNSTTGVDCVSSEGNVGSDISTVFPTSPPCFWGDASSNQWDDIYAHPVSPVPSITDSGEGSCRYSDSNSETLKAMETLYLCNFKVAVDGDWLCLKEINDLSFPSYLAARFKGLCPYRITTFKLRCAYQRRLYCST